MFRKVGDYSSLKLKVAIVDHNYMNELKLLDFQFQLRQNQNSFHVIHFLSPPEHSSFISQPQVVAPSFSCFMFYLCFVPFFLQFFSSTKTTFFFFYFVTDFFFLLFFGSLLLEVAYLGFHTCAIWRFFFSWNSSLICFVLVI